MLSVLRYNSMFALISLGMCFVIMTGGIDLSVGATAACASVVSALLSPYGLAARPARRPRRGPRASALLNGFMVTRMRILPFIATLAAMLTASGAGAAARAQPDRLGVLRHRFHGLGQGDLLGFPVPAWIAAAAYVYGSVVLNYHQLRPHVLAVGGNEEAARLMGLPVDRVEVLDLCAAGLFAGLAGVILAAQFGAGQPDEGVGWELFSIAAVVVGGTLLTGGMGSVGATLAGVLLLGLIFNVLNFENGLGWISLSAYWQSVVRGVFLMVVVMAGSGAARRVLRAT